MSALRFVSQFSLYYPGPPVLSRTTSIIQYNQHRAVIRQVWGVRAAHPGHSGCVVQVEMAFSLQPSARGLRPQLLSF